MAKLILKAPYYKQGHKTEDGEVAAVTQNILQPAKAWNFCAAAW